MKKVVIVEGARSPIGVKNGKMIGIRPDELGAQVVKGLLKKLKLRKRILKTWLPAVLFRRPPRVC